MKRSENLEQKQILEERTEKRTNKETQGASKPDTIKFCGGAELGVKIDLRNL